MSTEVYCLGVALRNMSLTKASSGIQTSICQVTLLKYYFLTSGGKKEYNLSVKARGKTRALIGEVVNIHILRISFEISCY